MLGNAVNQYPASKLNSNWGSFKNKINSTRMGSCNKLSQKLMVTESVERLRCFRKASAIEKKNPEKSARTMPVIRFYLEDPKADRSRTSR